MAQKTGTDLFLQRLFERIADDYGHIAEMEDEGEGFIVVRLTGERGRKHVVARCRLSMRANESGTPLVQVEDLRESSPVEVLVSPVTSAVIAVMLR